MKIFSKILAILCIPLFICLGIVYFFAFDIQWGYTTATLLWGLPLAIFAICTLAAGIFALKNVTWKWGVTGIGFAAAACVYTGILLNSFSYILLPQEVSKTNSDTVENKIIALAVIDDLARSNRYEDNKYVVISPDTTISIFLHYPSDIKDFTAQTGYDITPLAKELLEINQETARLSLASSVNDGYYVDYGNTFPRYFTNRYFGWLRWRLHPQVSGYLRVSLPAYDPETGYVLVSIRTVYNSYTEGHTDRNISLYRYIDGKLTYVDTPAQWHEFG